MLTAASTVISHTTSRSGKQPSVAAPKPGTRSQLPGCDGERVSWRRCRRGWRLRAGRPGAGQSGQVAAADGELADAAAGADRGAPQQPQRAAGSDGGAGNHSRCGVDGEQKLAGGLISAQHGAIWRSANGEPVTGDSGPSGESVNAAPDLPCFRDPRRFSFRLPGADGHPHRPAWHQLHLLSLIVSMEIRGGLLPCGPRRRTNQRTRSGTRAKSRCALSSCTPSRQIVPRAFR